MTESAWLARSDPMAMRAASSVDHEAAVPFGTLGWIQPAPNRKFRRFACASCRLARRATDVDTRERTSAVGDGAEADAAGESLQIPARAARALREFKRSYIGRVSRPVCGPGRDRLGPRDVTGVRPGDRPIPGRRALTS